MIPMRFINAWRDSAPWQSTDYVEQDLVISRALIEMFNVPNICSSLVFRGGTALNKYMESEDRSVSRAEFEKNLYEKQNDTFFTNDMKPLLSPLIEWDINEGFLQVMKNIVAYLPGKPWAGISEN